MAYYGYGILIYAVFINWLGKYFNLKSWHDILAAGNFRDSLFINKIWLAVIYPLLLGIGIFLLIKLKKNWSKNQKSKALKPQDMGGGKKNKNAG